MPEKSHLPGRKLPAVSFLDNHQLTMKKKPATTKGPPVMSPATILLRPAAAPPNMHPAIPHAVTSDPPSPSFHQAIRTLSAEATKRTVRIVDSAVHGSSADRAPEIIMSRKIAAANEPTTRAVQRSPFTATSETASERFIFPSYRLQCLMMLQVPPSWVGHSLLQELPTDRQTSQFDPR